MVTLAYHFCLSPTSSEPFQALVLFVSPSSTTPPSRIRRRRLLHSSTSECWCLCKNRLSSKTRTQIPALKNEKNWKSSHFSSIFHPSKKKNNGWIPNSNCWAFINFQGLWRWSVPAPSSRSNRPPRPVGFHRSLVVVEETDAVSYTRIVASLAFRCLFFLTKWIHQIINHHREKSILKKESVKNPLIISENVCRATKGLEFLHGDHVTKYDIKGRKNW